MGVGGVIVGSGGTLVTAVDIATGATVDPDDNNASGAVVPQSLTKDEDAYVGATVAFEGACIGAFVDDAGKSTAASALLPPRCHHHAVRRRHISHCLHLR